MVLPPTGRRLYCSFPTHSAAVRAAFVGTCQVDVDGRNENLNMRKEKERKMDIEHLTVCVQGL